MKDIILFCFVIIMVGGIFLLACLIPGNCLEKNSTENYGLEVKLPLWNEDKPFEYRNGSLEVRYMGLALRLDVFSSGVVKCTLFDIGSKVAVSFGGKSRAFLASGIDGLDGDSA